MVNEATCFRSIKLKNKAIIRYWISVFKVL